MTGLRQASQFPWPDGVQVTEEHELAAAFPATGEGNLFITGRAGTGKSTLLRCLREIIADQGIVLAPTGLAAINVGGQTIHSFFGFPPRLIGPDDIRRSRNGRIMRQLKFLDHRRSVDGALGSHVGDRSGTAY